MGSSYVDDLAHSSGDLFIAVSYDCSDDSVGVIGVDSVVAEAVDEMLAEEGVETGYKILYGLVGHFLLYHGFFLVLSHFKLYLNILIRFKSSPSSPNIKHSPKI